MICAMTADRTVFSSGSPWEPVVGYSRSVKVGPFISVSGTSAGGADGVVGGEDAGLQAAEVFARLAGALQTAGASLGDVVRTRVYLTDMANFDAVAKAHAATFGEIRPATTFLQVAALAGDDLLIEVEADAIIAGEL
jgi:enamine deaminase RidA (YjgF/YER057c/UK114 family)